MAKRLVPAFLFVPVIVSLVGVMPTEATASPARRLARRGLLVVPAPAPMLVPPFGPLRPVPFVVPPVPVVLPPFAVAPVAPLVPGGPAVVLGPAGRVRRVIVPGGPVAAPVVTVVETQVPTVASPPVADGIAGRPSPPAVTAATPPAPLPAERIPAPRPIPEPAAAAGGVVPAGAELEIPDGTRSVLVDPAGGGTPTPATRP